MRHLIIISALCFFLCCFWTRAEAIEKEVYVMHFSGAISPGSADFLNYGINKASEDNVACIIILLDTPGGLAESMRNIVQNILACEVPVVIYVAPSGARAASAGVMVTMAADIAAMAPGTNIGAAHPVSAGGKEINATMSEKITNDMVANAKSVAAKRGRNVQWVEKAIRESVSVTEAEALKNNIIDFIAKDTDDLIRQINGLVVEDKGVLSLDEARITLLKENLRNKILKTISDPNVAYILLMIGLAGLYFELSHPGAILPGVVGGISIILAFFAMQTIPVNYAGMLLILLALVFFIMEMKIASYGLLSIAGIVSLLLGSLMLFDSSDPGMQLSWKVLIPTLIMVSSFFATIAALVFKSHLAKPITGAKGLVGEIGVVKQALLPEGKVFVHGELWKANSEVPIYESAKVRVIDVENLVLKVEPVE